MQVYKRPIHQSFQTFNVIDSFFKKHSKGTIVSQLILFGTYLGTKHDSQALTLTRIATERQQVSKPIRKKKRIVKPPVSQISSRWEQRIHCLLHIHLFFALQVQ